MRGAAYTEKTFLITVFHYILPSFYQKNRHEKIPFHTGSPVRLHFAMQAANPVTWSYQLVDDGTDHPSVKMTATIAPGYHLYDFTHEGMETSSPSPSAVKA